MRRGLGPDLDVRVDQRRERQHDLRFAIQFGVQPKSERYGNPIGNGASSSNSSAAPGATATAAPAPPPAAARAARPVVSLSTTKPRPARRRPEPTQRQVAPPRRAATPSLAPTSPARRHSRNTPEIIPPSIVGGDPAPSVCPAASAAQASASSPVAVGKERHANGASWRHCINMGHGVPGAKGNTLQEAAVEVLVRRGRRQEACKRIGQPVHRRSSCRSPTPSPTAFAAPKIAVAIATPSPPESAVPKQRPDWCNTASAQ